MVSFLTISCPLLQHVNQCIALQCTVSIDKALTDEMFANVLMLALQWKYLTFLPTGWLGFKILTVLKLHDRAIYAINGIYMSVLERLEASNFL